jgi:glucosamine--fructose-6-phosphate aminotransferase (isomerizing)
MYLRAGPEISVASTKAFTAQLTGCVLAACWLAQNTMDNSKEKVDKSLKTAKELKKLPYLIEESIKLKPQIKKLATKLIDTDLLSFFGRTLNYPIALEGALKMKEISYLDATGLSTGSLKHGPIAAMDETRPAIVLTPYDKVFSKNKSNIQELKARDIPVYAITNESGVEELGNIADEILVIPETNYYLKPILNAVFVQLLAYETAVLLGRPIDKPRNLAKSVTVE